MNKNLIFLDLGGVVFKSTGQSTSQIDWTIITQLNNKYGHDLNIGLDKFPEFMMDYNTLSKQQLSGAEFLEKLFDTLEINIELINIVHKFGDIVIVSDNYRENIDYISKRYDFDSWAIGEVYSFDYQMAKSDYKFFEKLIQEYKEYDLEQIILIDDSPSKLESAAQQNIVGILYQSNDQTKQELAEYFDS